MNICKVSSQKPKALIMTIGCRLNQADSALLAARLESIGYEIISKNDSQDIPSLIVINTCAVTASASQKSRQALRNLRKKYPEAKIIVAGCAPVVEMKEWQNEKVADIVIGNEDKKKIAEIILANFAIKTQSEISSPIGEKFSENTFAVYPFRSRAFLKIQEGCNANCTYCIVPRARGPERSRNIDEIFCEFRNLIAQGFKEIILTGVNICAFKYENYTLSRLVKTLASEPGAFRIRLSSTEPDIELENIIEIIKNTPKICRFLHIPLQHGTDEILKRMGRKYSASDFANFATSAVNRIPGLHIGTDIITGFPGETEVLFQKSYDFIESLPLANLHIFRFSPRKGTPAANFPDQIPQRIAKERAEKLAELEKKLSSRFLDSQIGQTLPVLIEKAGRLASGWSDNYTKVFSDKCSAEKGAIVRLKIISKHDATTLFGIPESVENA
ncbi:MAG: tRNA (N(6)-L-threonylcarbamoyladenosine(37)-C(2))-methylthiotransferase MtaB [Candidatus Nanoarchaeia archaeon]